MKIKSNPLILTDIFWDFTKDRPNNKRETKFIREKI